LYIAEHTYSYRFAGQARIGDNVHTDRSTPKLLPTPTLNNLPDTFKTMYKCHVCQFYYSE